MKTTKCMTITIVMIFGIAVWVAGCDKSEPQPTEQTPASDVQQAAETIEQTLCPVMGNPINKDVFVEYQGKKVYFCCPECEEKFNSEPEKYLSKLPQFQE